MIKTITDRFLSSNKGISFVEISQIADIKAGGDCPKEFSISQTQEYPIPIYSNGIGTNALYGYTRNASIIKRGVSVAARGTIGYCARRRKPYVPIIRLLSITPYIDGGDTFIHQIFNKISFKKNGSVQQQLTVPEISHIRIPYPSKNILQQYEKITNVWIELIDKNDEEIESLAKQRDALLPLLMNGQVSVNYHLSHKDPCPERGINHSEVVIKEQRNQ